MVDQIFPSATTTTLTAQPEAPQAPAPVKPGYATTEFWLSLAATALTALFASGVMTSNTALAIAGMAATVLTALGYKVSRTMVKTGATALVKAGAALALVILLAGPQLACGGARERGANAAGAFLDCQAPNIVALLPDAIALARSAVMRWISGSGKVDASGLKNAAAPLKGDLGKCAFDAAIAALAAPPSPALAGAPASEGLTIDGAALTSSWARVRGELGWAAAAP